MHQNVAWYLEASLSLGYYMQQQMRHFNATFFDIVSSCWGFETAHLWKIVFGAMTKLNLGVSILEKLERAGYTLNMCMNTSHQPSRQSHGSRTREPAPPDHF